MIHRIISEQLLFLFTVTIPQERVSRSIFFSPILQIDSQLAKLAKESKVSPIAKISDVIVSHGFMAPEDRASISYGETKADILQTPFSKAELPAGQEFRPPTRIFLNQFKKMFQGLTSPSAQPNISNYFSHFTKVKSSYQSQGSVKGVPRALRWYNSSLRSRQNLSYSNYLARRVLMWCQLSSKCQYCGKMTKGEAKEGREQNSSPDMLERSSSNVGIRLLRQNT